MTPNFLATLEKPKRRTKAEMDAVRVGSAKDDCGLSERQIQRLIIKGLRKLGIRCAHVPNGAHLAGDAQARMRQMAALRADGLLPGFPDLLLWRPLPAGPVGGGGIAPSLPPIISPAPGVPEPETWGFLVIGFGLIGASMRRPNFTSTEGK